MRAQGDRSAPKALGGFEVSMWPKCEVCGKRYVRAKGSPSNYGQGSIELVHKCKGKPKPKRPASRKGGEV